MIRVRSAVPADVPRLLAIYDWYVRHTAVTFDYETPSPAAFRRKMETVMAAYPYLVLETDGTVCGYAYAGPFVGRAAYDWACETTIYLDPDHRGAGLGRILYQALFDALREMGILNLYACIGSPEGEDPYLTDASENFHSRMGFARVGTFRRCGYKFGRWYNMIWMEKLLGEHRPDPTPVDHNRQR